MSKTVEEIPYKYTFPCLDEATGEMIPVTTEGHFSILGENGKPCPIGDSNKALVPQGHYSVRIFPGLFYSTNDALNDRLTMGAMIDCSPKVVDGKLVKSDPTKMPLFSQRLAKYPNSSTLTENPDEVDENKKLKGKFYAESSSKAAAGLGRDHKCIAVTQTSGLLVVKFFVVKKPLPTPPPVEYSSFRGGGTTRGGDVTRSITRGGPSREVANLTRGDAVTNTYGSCGDRYVSGSLIEKQVRLYVLTEDEDVIKKAEELFKPTEEDEFVPIDLPETPEPSKTHD